MTDRQQIIPTDRVRSGRRFAVDIDAPRDRTVCFTVSDGERDAIDALAACLGRTRSSVLTRIVTAFVSDCAIGDQSEQILALFQECRAAVQSKPITIDRK